MSPKAVLCVKYIKPFHFRIKNHNVNYKYQSRPYTNSYQLYKTETINAVIHTKKCSNPQKCENQPVKNEED